MASYTRQSSFSDGDTISASLFNNEYNQLVTAFSYSSSGTTGHRHDGTAAEGGNIHTIGDQDFLNKIVVDSSNNRWGVYVQVSGAAVEQIRFQDGSIVPVTSNDIDLGTSSLQFKDLHIDGTANIDSLTLTSGSTVTVILDEDDLSTNSATALATQQSIKAYVDSQVTGQSLNFSGDSGGSLSIDLDSEALTITGGTGIDTTGSTNDMSIAIDSTVATLTGSQTLTNKTLTSPDINGGTIDGATIGGSSAGDITYANLSDGTITITAFADEDDMSSNSATLVPTQQSVKAYVDSKVTAEDLDFQADSGGALSIDLDSETMTFTGGTGIDTSGSGNAVTFAIDSTVTTLAGTQTLTNKTLTTPVITSISNSGTVTLPSGTTTLVGTATSDVLTNKTISGSSNTLSNIGNSSLSNSSVSFGGISVALGSSDATPAFDLSDATGYTGDSSLVTTGTISSGVWQGTAVADTYVANDLTISGGTVNNTVIGGSSPAAADFTTVDTTGNATIGGNLAVTGNLTINGTTSTVNSTTVTIDDPIFTLGGDTTPSTDDNKDRGIEFKWHSGTGAKLGFFGYDDSASVFTFIPDASNTSEVFSGSAGNVAFGAISGTSFASTGNMTFGDDDKAIFGAGSDLQIYHTGTYSLIADTSGTGPLRVVTNTFQLNNAADTQNMINAAEGGAVTLYNAGNAKLATTATGIDITGTATAASFETDAGGTFTTATGNDLNIVYPDGRSLFFKEAGTTTLTLDNAQGATFNGTVTAAKLASANGVLELDDNGTHNGVINAPATLFINIDSDANSTGEDFIVGKDRTGTSGGTELFRIESEGHVGILNSSPANYTGAGARSLVVGSNSSASTPHGISIVGGSSSTSNLAFTDNAGDGSANDYRGLFQYAHSDDSLRIFTASSERFRIAADGSLSTPTAGTSNVRFGVNAGNSIASGGDQNVLLGDEAGTAISTGDQNVAVGYLALGAEQTGSHNVAIGREALKTQNGGTGNVAIGRTAGSLLQNGSENVLIGYQTGDAITTSSENTAVGSQALSAQAGSRNVAIGRMALRDSQGQDNVAIGHQAAIHLSTGDQNTIIGKAAGDALTAGLSNVAVGFEALKNEDGHGLNTAIGTQALFLLDAGADGYHTAVGYQAGGAITNGLRNTFIGALAGDRVSTSSDSVAVGVHALGTEQLGANSVAIGKAALFAQNSAASGITYNTAVGYEAGYSNVQGTGNTLMGYLAGFGVSANNNSNNTFIGREAGKGITTGSGNTVSGGYAAFSNTTGGNNTASGFRALQDNTSGASNVAIGAYALDDNTEASNNTAVGYAALGAVNTGALNVGLGKEAGDAITTGGGNIILGALADVASASGNYANVMGYAVTGDAGYTTLGESGNDIRAAHGNVTWATVSDERYKKDIVDSEAGLSLINALRPRTFNYKNKGELPDSFRAYEEGSTEVFKSSQTQHGFIAQEVKAAIDADNSIKDGFKLWDERADGSQEVAEAALIPVLVKAIQELTARIEALES